MLRVRAGRDVDRIRSARSLLGIRVSFPHQYPHQEHQDHSTGGWSVVENLQAFPLHFQWLAGWGRKALDWGRLDPGSTIKPRPPCAAGAQQQPMMD
jgi:hypothetical protein